MHNKVKAQPLNEGTRKWWVGERIRFLTININSISKILKLATLKQLEFLNEISVNIYLNRIMFYSEIRIPTLYTI